MFSHHSFQVYNADIDLFPAKTSTFPNFKKSINQKNYICCSGRFKVVFAITFWMITS